MLAFPVELVRRRYLKVRGGARVLAGIVKDMFAEVGAGKFWLYHPAIQKAEPQQVIVEVSSPVIGSRPLVGRSLNPVGGGYLGKSGGRDAVVQAPPKRSESRPVDPPGTYRCYGCGHEWVGGEVSGRTCPHCGSDKLSAFRPL